MVSRRWDVFVFDEHDIYIYIYIIYIWDVLSFQITETLPVELMIEDGSQGESSQKYWKPGVFLV